MKRMESAPQVSKLCSIRKARTAFRKIGPGPVRAYMYQSRYWSRFHWTGLELRRSFLRAIISWCAFCGFTESAFFLSARDFSNPLAHSLFGTGRNAAFPKAHRFGLSSTENLGS